MKKHTKTLLISELITELMALKKEIGDAEVFVVNDEEMCFDGICRSFIVKSVRDNKGFAVLLKGEDIIKI